MQLKTLTEAVKVEFASTEYVIDGRKKVGNTLFMAAHKIVIRSLTTNEQYLEIIAQILSNGKGLEYDLGEIEASSPAISSVPFCGHSRNRRFNACFQGNLRQAQGRLAQMRSTRLCCCGGTSAKWRHANRAKTATSREEQRKCTAPASRISHS